MDNRQTLLARVRQYVAQHIPLTPQQLVLVGLSGGADSVALLSILTSLGYRCEACHCNFQLRGEESVRDRPFAREVAAGMGVPFREITFDTMSYASANKVSVEMACRELRYEWFEQQRREAGAAYVAVAHHRDDSIETMLLNLIRGTGITGLTGIQPLSGKVIRPLLSLSRAEIETYLFDSHLTYIVDSTNREPLYTRNKIRLQLLPLMQSINPSVYESLAHTLLNNLIKNAIVHSPDGGHIDVRLDCREVEISNDGAAALDPQRMFRRFHKGGTHQESTGLGLSIAQSIASLYHIGIGYRYDGRHHFLLKLAN